jgi:glyoxylase-like metal-dependent hydrolase (beta-lactamase superfamily II)
MTLSLVSIEGNTQRLDGGAMFGNCPRALWERWAKPDEKHRIPLACRALLVRETEPRRNVLLEAGIGAFFEPKLRERFGVVEERHVLLDSLAAAGVAPEEIDVVVLSHLHFDHAGGVLSAYEAGAPARLAFPRASYVVSRAAWERAKSPHARDRASFIPELQPLLEETGRLEIIGGRGEALPPEGHDRSETLGPRYTFVLSEGHTPGLMLTRVEGWDEGPITFLGDLIPGVPWVHLPITMGYDRYPERIIDEKKALLDRILGEQGWAFFTHDPGVAAARITREASGKYGATDLRARLG